MILLVVLVAEVGASAASEEETDGARVARLKRREASTLLVALETVGEAAARCQELAQVAPP